MPRNLHMGLFFLKKPCTGAKYLLKGFGIWGMPSHVHTTAHAYNIREVQKKACIVWFKKLQGVQQIACLKQQCFLSFTFYITQRSSEKIMCIYFSFHYFSGENCIIFLFSLHKERIKKEHEWRNNRFSDVFTYHLNPKNFASLFFLIQDNFML